MTKALDSLKIIVKNLISHKLFLIFLWFRYFLTKFPELVND